MQRSLKCFEAALFVAVADMGNTQCCPTVGVTRREFNKTLQKATCLIQVTLIAEHHAVIDKDFLVIGEPGVEAVKEWFSFTVVAFLEEAERSLEQEVARIASLGVP